MPVPFKLVDPKLKGNAWFYLFQAGLGTASLIAVLSVADLISDAVIVAAIGSTAFILFITPRSRMASPRHVIGGHVLAVLIGGGFNALVVSGAGEAVIDAVSFMFEVSVAFAVGFTLLAMAMTDSEHGPAAGTALGMVVIDFNWSLVGVFLISVILLSLTHKLLLRRLRDFA
jgi:CBS-domain-containing membrane protein